ncbi:MAG: hypothetical protein K2X51_17965 [Burkholderiales bacterium]|nr:hypothetical protein [Burkholderiales bacterium]
MSDAQNFGFGKLVPGFDFLQNLASSAVKGASQNIPQLPNLGNWIAPTLNVEELDKRIDELKAVQFWLDQNATALKATIQALEVQKMTLATLKGMNFNMGDVANAFKLKAADTVLSGVQKAGETAAATAHVVSDVAASVSQGAARVKSGTRKAATPTQKGGATAATGAGVVDPMQWWGALTQQFQQIAASAMKDAARKTALDTTRNVATGLAKGAIRTATGMAGSAARSATRSLTSGAASAGAAPRKTTAKAAGKAAAKTSANTSAKAPRKSARRATR